MPASDPHQVECPACHFVVPIAARCQECNSPLSALPLAGGVTTESSVSAPATTRSWESRFTLRAPPVPARPPSGGLGAGVGAPTGHEAAFLRAPPPPQNGLLKQFGAGSNTARIGEGIGHCLRETANIKGRTSKEAFGSYLLVVMALAAAIAFAISIVQPLLTTTRFITVSGIDMPMTDYDFEALYNLIAVGSVPLLVALVPLTTAAVRRLHDTGRSGAMVSIAYGLYALWIAMIVYGDVTIGSLGGVGLIVTMGGMIYYLTRPSEPIQNAYGPVTSI
jgi:uncharacterized membrane protein YhaH (DUF805 family)